MLQGHARSQSLSASWRHVPAHELRVALEASGREDEREAPAGQLAQRLAKPNLRRRGVPAPRVSRGTSKRAPVVSGLPVSRSTTGAPSDSSQARAPSRRSTTSACSAASPPGHCARNVSRSGSARRRRSRAASIRPGGRPSRGPPDSCTQLGCVHGRDETGHARARDDEIDPRVAWGRGMPRPTRARSSPCARRTRA